MKQLGRPQPKSPDANREDENVLNFFRSNGLQLMVQKNSVGFIMIQLQIAILASDSYRSGALSAYQTRRLLGFETRYELDGFLKAHNVWEHACSLEDLEQDRQTLQQLESDGRLQG